MKKRRQALNSEIPIAQDGGVPEWIMLARTGAWAGHPSGPEVVTTAHLASALDYFGRHYKANNADLTLDYHHASLAVPGRIGKAPAAGWIQAMDLRANGTELWGKVLWVAEAAREVAARAFRYISPVLRWNAPDRVTGDPVPMLIHSVALTNTPFMTELQALNEDKLAGTDAGEIDPPEHEAGTSSQGGESMDLLKLIATALGITPEDLASKLGLAVDAEVKVVAEACVGNVANAAKITDLEAKITDLEAQLAAQPAQAVNAAIAGMLGVAAGSDETAVRAAILKLQAGSDVRAVQRKLGLADDADSGLILNAIGELQASHRKDEAEALVDGAIEAGKIPPAQREFFLMAAKDNIGVAREAINSLPVVTAGQAHDRPADGGGTAKFDADDKAVCEMLDISKEAYLAAR